MGLFFFFLVHDTINESTKVGKKALDPITVLHLRGVLTRYFMNPVGWVRKRKQVEER